jgi:nucleotide-binding universal stress UspA family protein
MAECSDSENATTLKGVFMPTMQALETVNKISFNNILFLTDFTEASQTALAYALGFAKHFGAKLYPAHACDPIILTETAAPDILDEVEENSRSQLTTLANENNISGTPLFARGPVADAVPGWIAEHAIDLIVMGTHGRRGLKHLLIGSVAEAIFRNATCPVLTVGPHVTVRPSHDFHADKILFPNDLGTHAEFATQYALSIAQEGRSKLTFMHVVSTENASQRDRTQLVEDSYKNLETLLPKEANLWCKPELVVEVGDPVKELLAFAESERPDMIVLGLPAGKKFNGHFRSSVTYNVIAGAPCPVLTVRDVLNDQ